MFSLETLNENFDKVMNEAPAGAIGVAVSGGGDSLALLYLTADWAKRYDRTVKAVTIDHRLRAASNSECKYVKKIANDLLIEHSTLKWIEKPTGNLQKLARDARHGLLINWAAENDVSVMLLGHTIEDNAETILMRLSRGSGVDGLTGMSQTKNIKSLKIFRPLLQISRVELRNYLSFRNVEWIDEPSNFDTKYQRVKIRNAMPKLAALGLTTKKLIAFAEHMARAKSALDFEVLIFAKKNVKQKPWGDLEIEQEAFKQLSSEYQFRLLSAALRWISSNEYRPRFKSLRRLLTLIIVQGSMNGCSLMGCIVTSNGKKIIISRELSAVPNKKKILQLRFIWDKRWIIEVDSCMVEGFMIGPLGKDGLSQIRKETSINIPINALQSSVALFQNGRVQCVPVLDYGSGLSSEVEGGVEAFFNFLTTY